MVTRGSVNQDVPETGSRKWVPCDISKKKKSDAKFPNEEREQDISEKERGKAFLDKQGRKKLSKFLNNYRI